MNWMMVAGVIFLAIWFVREYMAVLIPENMAFILMDCLGRIRKLRQGIQFKRPWLFEVPAKNTSGGLVPLRYSKIKFDGIYEAKGFTIKLSTTFIIRPVFDYLEKYIQFEDSERTAAIIERVRNIISIIISKYESREDVKRDLEVIGQLVNKAFSDAHDDHPSLRIDLEHFYGVKADQFVVDPENPAELVEAQNRLEAQNKENARQKSETDNFGNMAEDLVNRSKKLESPMSTKEAMETALVIHGKASRETEVKDLGPGAQKAVEGLAGVAESLGKAIIDAAEKIAKKREGDKDVKE